MKRKLQFTYIKKMRPYSSTKRTYKSSLKYLNYKLSNEIKKGNTMTSLFKLLCFLILASSIRNTKASIIEIQYETSNDKRASIAAKLFSKKLNIPRVLIKLESVQECQSRDTRYFEVCINKKGELYKLSHHDFNNYRKSFEVFKR